MVLTQSVEESIPTQERGNERENFFVSLCLCGKKNLADLSVLSG